MRFGDLGGTVTLLLNATSPISLANESWNVQEQNDGLDTGRWRGEALTIQSQDPSSMAVLDTAMRSGLTPVLRDVSVTWQVGRMHRLLVPYCLSSLSL